MKVINYKNIPPVALDNEAVKNIAGRVLIGKEDKAEHFCMRLFEMGPGGHTPEHSHDWEHEVFIHAGKGDVLIQDTRYPLETGSAVLVPANTIHQFRNTGDEALVFICLVPTGAPEL